MIVAYEHLRVESKINYIQLKRIKLENALNHHASLCLELVLDHDDQSVEKLTSTDEIKLVDEESGTLLFCGLIGTSELTYDNNYKYLQLTVVSASCLLDYRKRTRTFQGMTFNEILEEIFKSYETKAYVNVNDDTHGFEIQYNETDFEFVKRLASQRSLVVMPHLKDSQAKLYIDIKNKSRHLKVDTEDFRRYDYSETHDAYERSYYVFKSFEYLELGDLVDLQGHTLLITQSKGLLEDGLMVFEYQATLKYYVRIKPYEHPYFAGSGLEASVLAVENRSIKVQFDVDETQDLSKAVWIPYGPVGCSAWYTMPAVGNKVLVKFENESASSAIGVSMFRQGHDDIETMSDPKHKAFTIKEGSHLSMTPSQIALANDYTSISLGDTIEVVSNDSLVLASDNEMNIGKTMTEYIDGNGALAFSIKETKSIHIEASELLSMVVLSKGTGLEIDEELVINSLGKTDCVGTEKVAYESIVVVNDMSALQESVPELSSDEEDKGGFWSKVGKAVAITAAVVAVAVVAVAVAPVVASVAVAAGSAIAANAGVIATGAAIGASISVGVTAAVDLSDGKLDAGAGEYIKSALMGGLAGGLGAGVSSLGVVARIGIEAGGDFVMDVTSQLLSPDVGFADINYGQSFFTASLGLVIGEAAGKVAAPVFKNVKNIFGIAAEEVTEEVLEEVSEEITEELTEEVTEEITEEVAEETLEVVGKTFDDGVEGASKAATGVTKSKIFDNFTTEEINVLKTKVIEEGQMLKDIGLTNKELGPAIAGVYDKSTGKFYTAINNVDGKIPSELAPIIEEKITNMPDEVLKTYMEYTKGTGSHAEIYAVNKALLDNSNAKIEDLLVYVNRTLGTSKPVTEVPFKTCPHCKYILDGFNVLSNVQ